MFNPVSALLGGVIGWTLRGNGRGGQQAFEPVDVADAVERLRGEQPRTYRKVNLDMSQARSNEELVFTGDWLAFRDVDSTVDLEVRLNERENDLLNLSRLRQMRQLYYRVFLTNAAGSGSVDLFLSLGGEFYPPDATTVNVESDPGLISGTLANRPTAGLQNRLYWATDVKILYRDTGDAWERASSLVVFDLAVNRPAAGTADRLFYATDDGIWYRDTGSTWAKLGTSDHADLDGQTTDDHHAQSHGHTGGDGSGTVAHGDTTGQGADDHHAQDHAARHQQGGADQVTPAEHASRHEPGGADALAVDAAAGTGSLRTLGTGSQQALPGAHSGVAKAWADVAPDGTISDSYNVSSVSKTGTGDYTINWDINFSSGAYAVAAAAGQIGVIIQTQASGSLDITLADSNGAPQDDRFSVVAFGAQ